MSPEPMWQCPECGAGNGPNARTCFLCRQPRDAAAPAYAPPSRPRGTWHLGMISTFVIFAILTLILAGVLLEARNDPDFPYGVFIVVAILLAPIMVWLCKQDTKPGGMQKWLAVLLVIFVASVAGFAAFFAACWGGFFAGAFVSEKLGAQHYDPLGWGMLTAFILGPVAGITATVVLSIQLWRRHR